MQTRTATRPRCLTGEPARRRRRNRSHPALFLLLALVPLAPALATPPVAAPSRRPQRPAPAATSVPYRWKNVTIVAGGFVPGIVFSPVRQGLVYLRTDIGGFYRSDDDGQHWTPLTDWVDDDHGNWLGGESIVADPVKSNVVYAAAGMYSSNAAAFLRSVDEGRSWQATPVPIRMGGNEDGRGCGERLAVDPNDPDTLYFGSRYDGLWKSPDGGSTWAQVDTFPTLPSGIVGDWRHAGYGIGFVLFDQRSGSGGAASHIIYAGVTQPGAPAALYRSKDAGASWQAVPGLPAGLVAHHGAIDAAGSLYLTLGDKPGPNGVTSGAVYKLNTATDTWTDITPEHPTPEHPFGYAGLSLDRQHSGVLVVTTADRWNPGDDVFRSTDGGKSWSPIKPTQQIDVSLSPYLKWGAAQPREGWWMDAVAIDPFDSNHVMYGTGATVYGTHDINNAMTGQPTHWTVSAAGVEETAAICLISPPTGAHLVSGLGDVCGFVHDDFAVSPPQGMMSNPIDDSTDGLDFAQNRPAVMVRTGDKPAAISSDGGRSWKPFASQPLHGRDNSIAISADGARIVWGNRRGGTFVSADGGASWQPVGQLPAGAIVAADRIDPRTFWAIGDGKLWASHEGGSSFAAVASGVASRAALAVAPDRAGDVWIANRFDGLRRLGAGGMLTKVPGVEFAKLVAFGKPAPGRAELAVYVAGTVRAKSSIYRSIDGGQSWLGVEDAAHQFGWLPDALAGDPRVFGRVFLGTNGRGVIYGEPAGTLNASPSR